jgi:hypothetical protein
MPRSKAAKVIETPAQLKLVRSQAQRQSAFARHSGIKQASLSFALLDATAGQQYSNRILVRPPLDTHV